MNVPHEIWVIFLFALGASTGSFLNVVVYRLPRDMSIIRPRSHCVACQHPLAWYDNLPIIGWFLLRGRCRYCRARFSIRYALVELLTALLFVGLYWLYFHARVRDMMPPFEWGGALIYGGHIFLICALLASSLIDAEHWIIPLSVAYAAALVGVILSAAWPYCLPASPDHLWRLIPYAGPGIAAAALGAGLGLIAALIMLKTGLIERSFAQLDTCQTAHESAAAGQSPPQLPAGINVRREMLREVTFLAPPAAAGALLLWALSGTNDLAQWWQTTISQQKWLAGLLGSVFGFMMGAAVVWATRILGSLAFGREAMGLGDVHLMAAVGAVLGWASPVMAFFVAPFFGLAWALARLIVWRSREIPYGPFLSMATVLVMILHDPIADYFARAWTVSPPPP